MKRHEFFKRGQLVNNPLVTEIEFQFGGAFAHHSRFSPRNNADQDAGLPEVSDNTFVPYVKTFEFFAGLVVSDLSIGQYTIDTKKNGLDLGRFLDLIFGISVQNLLNWHLSARKVKNRPKIRKSFGFLA